MSEMIVQVRNKILRRIGGVNHFVSHNKDYTIQFQFDESWNNVRTKMAVFAYEDGEYGSEIFDGDTCNVPELPREGRILIGVKAGEDLATELLCIPVCKSADDVITDEYDEPDPKIYEQILDIINNLWNGGTTVYPSPVKFLASPSAAKVGDLIRVKEVDENGDVTRTEGFDVGVELEKKIDAPQVAKIGEVLTVEEVDEDGKPIKWKTQTVETEPPDWDENDSTKPGYVKNRPGGFFTKQERIVTLNGQGDSAGAMIPATDPQSTVLSIDGENRTIEFTYNEEYGEYFYADEGTGIEFYLTPANSKYSYIYFETVEDGTHTVRLTELIPHEFYDVLIPSSAKRNLEFIPDNIGEFTEEEINSFSKIIGTVTLTKKYDNLPKYNPLLSSTDGVLFIGGKFIEEKNKLITINSLSSEAQTFEDFVDTYGFIFLKVLDTNGYNTYIVPMYIDEPHGITNVDGKNYYTCAQATAYINGHLFAFHAYQYAYRGNKLHSMLTVKQIL